MRRALLLIGLAAGTPAAAQTVTLKPLVDTRLRYEHADQQGLPATADALTLRVRTGLEAKSGPWSALAEAQGNLAIVDRYDDGLHGPSPRALIADPQNVALYRAQLQYRTRAVALTAGRQRIALGDERFVGGIGFRQNGQTFDAVRAELTALPGLRIDVSYAWEARTIWGFDGIAARQAAVSGDNVFVNVTQATPIGSLTGFGYWIDQDEAAVQGYRLSSRTFGANLTGMRQLGPTRLGYQLSYARQSDHHRNPNDYAASYYLIDATLGFGGAKLGAGYEVLGADRGAALTSFQTPLGTNFKFQGWADKFLTTPPDGVRDLYASAGWGWKAIGALKAVTLQATWHRFESDRLVRHYGDEIDLLASARIGPTTASLRYADYRADRLATDTRKFWLQLDWTI